MLRPFQSRYRRLRLNALEDRMVPTTFTAGTVPELIADISASNTTGGVNTINLVAGVTFTLTAEYQDGTGLPTITANDNLSIVGHGNVIERSKSSPGFRLFNVAAGASLTLDDMTLQRGYASYPAVGGAVRSSGTLTL